MNHGSTLTVDPRPDRATATMATAQVDAYPTGRRAAEILDLVEEHPLFDRLRASTLAYPECWATFTGYPVINEWDLDEDGPHLFEEALRTMAMKAAVYDATGDERAAELDVAAPVDEMVHALTAQFTLLSRIQTDLGVTFIHSTDNERFQYDADGLTDMIYRAAGWGEPRRRYWIGKAETARRLSVLLGLYESIGINRGGRSHLLNF
ncbi:hypothetical protein [Parafrankia soli]|nr:hypothetical protein [Parafrankia soli]